MLVKKCFFKQIFLLSTIIALIIFVITPSLAFGNCNKEDVCKMANKMSPFSILDQCPESAPIIAQCKTSARLNLNDLPTPEFVSLEGGGIRDLKNNLLWMQTEIPNEKKNFNDAIRFAKSYSIGNQANWRLPTLPELKSLMSKTRLRTRSGKRSYLLAPFDDGVQWNQYWTTTDCNSVNFISDKYGKKHCQEGESSVWFVNFKLGAIGWNFKKSINQIWLVKNIQVDRTLN